MHPNIQKHITQTYINLRLGMAALAFLLPLLLMLGSWLSKNLVLQESISAFYHTPMRDLFVGVMVAVGAFLYLYKGFSVKENIALNLAGIFAVGVAYLPTSVPGTSGPRFSQPWFTVDPFTAPYLHGFCAVAMFVAIAYVCIFCGEETVALIKEEKVKRRYMATYRFLGSLMVVLPILAVVISLLIARDHWVFIVEFVAIWVFACFWLTKVKELDYHHSKRVECELLRHG